MIALDISLLSGGSREGEGISQDRVLSNVLAPHPSPPVRTEGMKRQFPDISLFSRIKRRDFLGVSDA